MIPCSLLIENIFSVFRSPQLPFDTQFWTRGLPFATRARKREPCNQRYISKYMTRNIWIEPKLFLSQKKLPSQNFFKFFWKPLFSTFHDTLFVIKRKYFFGFSKSAPTPRYTILDSRLPLCNTSSEAGALLPAIRGTYRNMTLTKKNSKSKFFKIFYENYFSPLFMIPCSLLIENIFSVKISQHFFLIQGSPHIWLLVSDKYLRCFI